MPCLFVDPSAAHRLEQASEFLRALDPSVEVLVVGATREAADDLARGLAVGRGATMGLHRFSTSQLAAQLAAGEMAQRGLAPGTPLATEALAARVTADLVAIGGLPYFAPVAAAPGFARALAATIAELRLAGVSAASLGRARSPGPDLAALLAAYTRQLEAAGIGDRAAFLALATAALRARTTRFEGWPLVLLDVPVDSAAEAEFLAALVSCAGEVLFTVAAGDLPTAARAREILGPSVRRASGSRTDAAAVEESSLTHVQRFLFAPDSPASRAADDSVRFFSAPGEERECVEIARFVLDEARAGTPFDRMAVFLRAPETYAPLLEAAFRRAGVPAYFARGTTRPDPAGRAFLALLACREENLSASRFAEFLSLARVPGEDGVAAAAEVDEEAAGSAGAPPSIRAPWRWEDLLVDAAVIGGRDRWQRRLEGLQEDLLLKLEAVTAEDPDSARVAALRRDLEDVSHLRAFALPVVDLLEELPLGAAWGDWLPLLRRLAETTLYRPARVLGVLEELAPMGGVGPVAIDEVNRVLGERLALLARDPPARRWGRVFVAPAGQARGRSFAAVFVPGLAERIFPQRPREDPLLLDDLRRELSPRLRTQVDRAVEERLLLQLAAGAAEARLYLSYPRVDVGEARPRVTSFYGLDVIRATLGELPDFEQLERQAAAAVRARLAWPAPPDPERAIDAVEHDLAVLDPLLHGTDLAHAKGRAKYLLELNPWLAGSLRTRYARWQIDRWGPRDGLCGASRDAVRAALVEHRPHRRAYSATALQRYAVCPYQFLLASIYRFEARSDPVPLERLDPLTRGSLFHEVQAATLRRLRDTAGGGKAIHHIDVGTACPVLDEVLAAVASDYRDRLAPPIARVWNDEIDRVRADLHAWLGRLAESGDEWRPRFFELAFGLPADPGRDEGSVAEAVELPGGWKLRGSVDLVEEARDGASVRVTDHKTGRDATPPRLVVAGGEVLQPVLYGLAIEAVTGRPVSEARLYYCTTRGGFNTRVVPLTDSARRLGLAVVEEIDRAVEAGVLLPSPREKACAYCDFRPACGPYEEQRAARFKQPLPELARLREMP
jgi:hypothetical protein